MVNWNIRNTKNWSVPSRVVWTVLASFLLYNFEYRASIFFYASVNCHTPFKVWISFQHFILCIYSVIQYLQEFLLCGVFCQSHHFWDICIPFVTTYSLSWFMRISSLLLSFSDCISRVSWMAVVLTFPQSVILWCHLHFIWISLPTLLLYISLFFHFCCPASSFDNPS